MYIKYEVICAIVIDLPFCHFCGELKRKRKKKQLSQITLNKILNHFEFLIIIAMASNYLNL